MQYTEEETAIKIRKILKEANMCLIFTGAGMGADSGLSVFRGNAGLWEKYPDAKTLNLSFQELANPQNYINYPNVVIPFYLDRYTNYVQAEPHAGFYELYGYAKSLPKGYFCVTSNVDGLFQKSNFENVYEIHGSIHKWQCSNRKCNKENKQQNLHTIVEKDLSDIENLKCDYCGSFLRPNLLMFYDFDWVDDIYEIQRIQYETFYNRYFEYNKPKVAIIEIGAGSSLRTIRSMAEQSAIDFKTQVIRINPDKQEEDLDDLDVIFVNKKAQEGIEYIMKFIN